MFAIDWGSLTTRVDPPLALVLVTGVCAFVAVAVDGVLGAVRPISVLRGRRRRRPGLNTDADQLARLTSVPAPVWVALFGAVILGSLAGGGWSLLA